MNAPVKVDAKKALRISGIVKSASYKLVVIDPPWPERGGGKSKRGADRHYKLLRSPWEILEVIIRSPVWAPDRKGCALGIWYTDNYLDDARLIMEALGFSYKRQFNWHKEGRFGLGQYLRGKHESMLIGVCGRVKRLARNQPSSISAPRRKHSEKPAQAYDILQAVFPGPRLEMFAREQRAGWRCWGDEAG